MGNHHAASVQEPLHDLILLPRAIMMLLQPQQAARNLLLLSPLGRVHRAIPSAGATLRQLARDRRLPLQISRLLLRLDRKVDPG
jgi:hypothetical protein